MVAKGKGAVMQVALRWNKNTGNIAVTCGAAEMGNAFATIKGIDTAYSQFLDGNVTPPPRGREILASYFRKPPWHGNAPEPRKRVV